MRLLRNLSISLKLALSAGVAVALLAALAATSLQSFVQLAALQGRASNAAAAVQRVAEAERAGVELRVISRDIAGEQTGAGLKELTGRAEGEVRIIRDGLDWLAWLKNVRPRSGKPEPLSVAGGAVDAYAKVIEQEASLRRQILFTRERELIRPRADFEASLKTFDQELTFGGVPSGVDAVTGAAPAALPGGTPETLRRARELFDAYQLAMARVQNAALLFLATGNAGAINAVADGVEAAEGRMNELLALPLPAAIQSDAKVPQILGQGIARAAKEVIAGARRVNGFVHTDVEQASAVLADRLASVADLERSSAEDARARAEAAAAAAARRLLLIGGGIALVLLLSSWLTSRVVARPIASMTRAVQKLAEGEAEVSFGHGGRCDEVGRMAAALERLRGVVRDAFLRSQMIEQIPLGVMTAARADAAFPITYVNPAARELMGLVAAQLPAPPDQLVGEDAAGLHPQTSRAMLADPERLPTGERLVLGAETLDVVVSAIRDRTGAYVGPMMTWKRATGQAGLVHRFEATVGAIARAVGDRAAAMTETAGEMNAAAREAGGRAEAVARASEQASSSVAAAAVGAEQLAGSIAEIGRRVAELARIAGRAVEEAEATDRSVGGLSEAARRIGDVVRLIGDIAGRTNLLALNATIEAARAGDAGKGFAVVASEVKNLASQTARATEEIGAQIAAMQGATGHAVEALRSIGATIGRMSEIATMIAGAVEEQSAATREIARAVQHAAAGTAEVTGTITLVSEEVGRTGAEADHVLTTASELASQSAALKAEADAFLDAVQKAA